jgi:hypothetical protein
MRRLVALLALVAALAAGCGGSHTAASRAASPAVRDLHSVAELRSSFDAQRGVPRLIVLVSPT